MNGEERQLITDLFERMRGVGSVEKDREAEALITQYVRQMPDAAYMLVQSVLVQEHALQQAGGRIEELEDRVRQLEQQTARPAQQGSGSFLGGLFGGGAAAPAPAARGSVPAFGQGRPMGAPPAAGGGAWGSAPGYSQPQPMRQPAATGGGGGFLKTAMMTAAGVAGGMLLANSISNMMKGDSSTPSTASNDMASNAPEQVGYDDADNDPGTIDTASDGGGGWGGGDGGDMDI